MVPWDRDGHSLWLRGKNSIADRLSLRGARPRLFLTLLFTAIGLCAAVNALSWNGFTLLEWWRETHSGVVLSQAQTRRKVVALTFDDGPDLRYTPRVLALLKRYHVKATFFEEGREVEAHPELSRLVASQGHILGNHTLTHPYLLRQSAKGIRHEMAGGEQCLEDALHCKTYLFRPPRGQWNPTVFREARREGDHIILWSVGVEHHDVHTARSMAARALRLVRPGGILLMHDGGGNRETTVQALPLILDGLRKRGYRCVTVPQLLHIRGDAPLPPTLQDVAKRPAARRDTADKPATAHTASFTPGFVLH